MRGVLLALTAPAWWWCARLARRFQGLGIRFMHLVPIGPARSVATVRLHGDAAGDVTAWLRREGALDHGVLLRQAPGEALWRIATRRCWLTRIVYETAVVPRFPFSVHDGEVHWLLLGQTTPSRALRDWCGEHDVRMRMLRAGPLEAARDQLTEHQHDVFQAAVRAGYYDHPRRITLTDLAGRIGVVKSTLSRMLMVVEHKIMHAHREDDRYPLLLRPGRAGAVHVRGGGGGQAGDGR